MIQVATNNAFMFIQDNAPCPKAKEVLEFLEENHIPIYGMGTAISRPQSDRESMSCL